MWNRNSCYPMKSKRKNAEEVWSVLNLFFLKNQNVNKYIFIASNQLRNIHFTYEQKISLQKEKNSGIRNCWDRYSFPSLYRIDIQESDIKNHHYENEKKMFPLDFSISPDAQSFQINPPSETFDFAHISSNVLMQNYSKDYH